MSINILHIIIYISSKLNMSVVDVSKSDTLPHGSFWASSLLTYNFHSHSVKPVSHYLPSINVIVQFQSTYTAVSECEPIPLWETTTSTGVQCYV